MRLSKNYFLGSLLIIFMMRTIIIYSFAAFLLTSCAIKGNFKGLYSYYNQTSKNNPELFYFPSEKENLCEISLINSPSKIIITNGLELKKCIDFNKNYLLYLWGPFCHSDVCLPLEFIQSYCDEKNIELIIVAEYFDWEEMNVNYKIKKPIYGIDTKYYETNLTNKYTKKFFYDMDKNITEFDLNNRFFFFKNGVFNKSFESIDEINEPKKK